MTVEMSRFNQIKIVNQSSIVFENGQMSSHHQSGEVHERREGSTVLVRQKPPASVFIATTTLHLLEGPYCLQTVPVRFEHGVPVAPLSVLRGTTALVAPRHQQTFGTNNEQAPRAQPHPYRHPARSHSSQCSHHDSRIPGPLIDQLKPRRPLDSVLLERRRRDQQQSTPRLAD